MASTEERTRVEKSKLDDNNDEFNISTVEMHTGGGPVRIVTSGYPKLEGETILLKRRYVKANLDHFRTALIFEPRGHYDMYGALLVEPDLPEADLAVLFMHNEGYGTMCGHAVISLGRYAIDHGLVKATAPETTVNIQCPCGIVRAHVEYQNGKTGSTRFNSVPAFAFATDIEVTVPGHGKILLDIGYGGAFYAYVPAKVLGLDVTSSKAKELGAVGAVVSKAVKEQVKLTHPDNDELAFLCGTILTDGNEVYSTEAAVQVCTFADAEVDRSPCGSGVTGRIAIQHHKGQIQLNQTRVFKNGKTGSPFTGKPVSQTKCGNFDAVVVEVSGHGYYTGTSTFTMEEGDRFKHGFLIK